MPQVHQLLLELPTWMYVVVAPLFTVLNLVTAAGLIGWLKRRTARIQEGPPDNTPTHHVTFTLFKTYALLSGFAAATLYGLTRVSNVSWSEVTLLNTLPAILLVLLGNDVLYWGYHRLMHTDFFWHRLHYIHHESRSPNSLRHTFYEHPVDFFFGTLCAVLPLLVVPIHIVAAIVCLFLQTFLAIAYHSGHDIRVPGLFTSRRHDDHHRFCFGNSAQNFALVDILFGTVIVDRARLTKDAATPAPVPVAPGE